MKKLILGLALVLLLASPYFLPMPIATSGWLAQYARGDTIELHISSWNVSPLARTVDGSEATSIVLKVDGMPVATTTTDTPPRIAPFSRSTQSVSYIIGKKDVQVAGFDEATGELELPAGQHDLSIEWLGSTTFSRSVTIVQI